jgi:hypothetical protein
MKNVRPFAHKHVARQLETTRFMDEKRIGHGRTRVALLEEDNRQMRFLLEEKMDGLSKRRK